MWRGNRLHAIARHTSSAADETRHKPSFLRAHNIFARICQLNCPMSCLPRMTIPTQRTTLVGVTALTLKDRAKSAIDTLSGPTIMLQGVDSRKMKTTGDSTRGSVGDSAFQGSPPRGVTLHPFGVLKILRPEGHIGSNPIRPTKKGTRA